MKSIHEKSFNYALTYSFIVRIYLFLLRHKVHLTQIKVERLKQIKLKLSFLAAFIPKAIRRYFARDFQN